MGCVGSWVQIPPARRFNLKQKGGIIVDTEKNLRCSKKYQQVLAFIQEERKKRGIKQEDLYEVCLSETSAEAYGEAYIFVERQLMHTTEDCNGTWGLIARDNVTLDLAFDYIFFGKRG